MQIERMIHYYRIETKYRNKQCSKKCPHIKEILISKSENEYRCLNPLYNDSRTPNGIYLSYSKNAKPIRCEKCIKDLALKVIDKKWKGNILIFKKI